MSDYNKNRRFNNDRETQRLRELRREEMELRSNLRFQCDHNPRGTTVIEQVTDAKESELGYKPTKLAKHPENVFYCRDCGSVFELTTFSKKDFDRWTFQMRSAFEQMKALINLNDTEYDDIVKIIGVIEHLREVGWRSYDKFILNQVGDNKKQNKKSQKGSINISGSLNRR